jgi:UDP-glucose 4-epimerase
VAHVFITGIAGFLGSHLADRLLAEGHKVSGIDNLIGGYKDNIPTPPGGGVDFNQVDCLDSEKIVELTKNVDVIYHTACTPYEGLSVFSPHLVTINTFSATTSVFSAGIKNQISRFVYLSSMARYGTQERFPFHEEMEPKPQDPYGIAKYASELSIKNLSEMHGIEFVISVPHNIIGPRQKYDDPFRNVASIMINLMLQGRQPFIYGDGEQKRCFSFINDVIDPLMKIGFQKGISGEIINIGPDEGTVSINDLARTIAKLINFKLDPIYKIGRPLEVKNATCSADKARKLLDYKTNYTLEQGLQEMIDYIETRGPKKFEYHLPIEIQTNQTPETWTKKLF